ncbi:MAG: tRNA lysidine(34) synthetase TilS [Clostridia bacterium]|nr:tRNA lysidine(34) synthetase TilS [Clostridia bacterium]
MDASRLIEKAIKDYSMPSLEEEILVGFSGGGDSVCLLSVLHEMGYKLTAAHLNHNMRATAKRDMLFCKEFCEKRGIRFVSKTMEKGALKNEISAREARYEFFSEVMKENDISYLATAHNKDDFSESVMLHFFRGSALDGLTGISPKTKNIIRPLILTTKTEVLEYLKENNIEYMTDETNELDIYTRNKVRHHLIPWIEREINPNITDVIFKNATHFKEDAEFLNDLATEIYENNKLTKDFLKEQRYPIKSRLVELLWKDTTKSEQNLSGIYVDSILSLLDKENGKSVSLPNGYSAWTDRDILFIGKREKTDFFEGGLTIGEFTLVPEIGKKIGVFSENGFKISVPIGAKLIFRQRKKGDRFKPYGIDGTKSVSDLLTDLKVKKEERDKIPVILSEDKIISVGNLRASREFADSENKQNMYLRIEEL